jgi:uncharacterized membrane protein YfcA
MTTTLLVAGFVLAFGALVQGMVGIGVAIVSVPVVALVQPELVPGPLILVTQILTGLTLAREFHDVDWRGVCWAMAGRLPGTVIGVVIVDSLPQKQFLLVVGTGVLIFTVLSMISWQPEPTVPALATAGLVSGAFGTAMAIGGPPVALLYQRDTGARIRSTMAAYLLLGGFLSAASLAVAGRLGGHELWLATLLLPFVILGFALSGPARRLVDGGRVRHAVLAVAGASAVMLIGRSLLL